jgi:poly-beta-1,6-N-acetyl-D-glucosamine synthase
MITFYIILSLAILTGILYSIIISVFTYGWFRLKETSLTNINEEIMVSVIVPFRNEEKNLASLLECLSNQYYSLEFLEVILVDDHSEDLSQKLVRDYIEANQLSNFKVLSLLDGEGISKKAALSKGIEHAKGELIITTDADCTMSEFWVSAIACQYFSEKCQLISSPVCILPERSIFSKLQSLEFFSLIGCGAGAIAINKPFLANGANLAFSRSLYYKLNGYSNHINYASGDDVFMLLQAKQQHNITFLKDKAAIVYTKGAPTLKTFFHQRIRWASKSSGYKDVTALITALGVFFLNSLILISCGFGLLDTKIFFVTGGLLLIKILIDLSLFITVSSFFKHQRLMCFYLPLQLFYTIYIIATAILSLVIPFEWKNRIMRK